MKLSSKYPSWELQPRKLSAKEVKNPHLIVDEFFDYARITQVRDLLWAWLESTITGDFPKGLSRRERGRIISFYNHIEKLIEGVHVLHVQQKSKSSKKKSKK
jgi:hypothetical protein